NVTRLRGAMKPSTATRAEWCRRLWGYRACLRRVSEKPPVRCPRELLPVTSRHRPSSGLSAVNESIQAFVDELIADPEVRGVCLFGSHAKGVARVGSDADLVVLVDRPGFVMGYA